MVTLYSKNGTTHEQTDGSEIDYRAGIDGTAFEAHHPGAEFLYGDPRTVAEKTWNTVLQRFGLAPERRPFEDALAALGEDKTPIIDDKSMYIQPWEALETLENKILKDAERTGRPLDRYTVVGTREIIANYFADLPVETGLSYPHGIRRLWHGDHVERAVDAGADTVLFPASHTTEQRVNQAREHGLDVVAWSPESVDQFDTLLGDLEVTRFILPEPGQYIHYL